MKFFLVCVILRFVSCYASAEDEITGNPFHDAAELIDAQLLFIENVISLLGQVNSQTLFYMEKKISGNTTEGRKKRDSALEQMKDINMRANYLVHQKCNIMKSMFNLMFPGMESDDLPEEDDQEIAQELLQHLTECKYFFFNYLHEAHVELARTMELPYDEKDFKEWEKKIDEPKKKLIQDITQLSKDYSLNVPILMHKTSPKNTTE